jgi:hypothetical protein
MGLLTLVFGIQSSLWSMIKIIRLPQPHKIAIGTRTLAKGHCSQAYVSLFRNECL